MSVKFLSHKGRLAAWLGLRFADRSAFFRTMACYFDADAVISSGGTYLVDHYNFAPRATELVFAHRIGVPVYLWTQSAGPFKSTGSIKSARAIAEVINGGLFRDTRSLKYWSSLGMYVARTEVRPDAAFALSSAPYSPPKHRMLLSVRSWSLTSDGAALTAGSYESAHKAVASSLISSGFQAVAMSTCQGLDGYIDDSATAREIFSETDVDIDAVHRTPDELAIEIRASSAVLTTRMHMAILSLVNKTPVVAIAYEFKTLELFNSLGLGHAVIRIEDVNDDRLAAAVKNMLDEPSRHILSDAKLAELRDACVGACEILANMPGPESATATTR